jgi:hypothetical protein
LSRTLVLTAALAVLVSISADCGGADGGDGPPQDAGGTRDDTGGTGDDTGGNGAGGVTIEYPAGGPVDPIFPTDDPAYEWLSEGQCQRLLDAVATWEVLPEKGSPEGSVADFHGPDTIAVYRSAANACLLRWDEAENAFEQVAGGLTFTAIVTDEGRCARRAVHEWVAGLLEAHGEDSSFSPTFVPASGSSQCPTGDLDGDTPDDGDGDTLDDGDGEIPDDGDGEIPDDGDGEIPDDGDGERYTITATARYPITATAKTSRRGPSKRSGGEPRRWMTRARRAGIGSAGAH